MRRLLVTTLLFATIGAGCGAEESDDRAGSNSTETTPDAGSNPDAGAAEDSGGMTASDCTSDDTSGCISLPNSVVEGCVIGQCAYSCEPGFQDQNGDLSASESDGCETASSPRCSRVDLATDADPASELHISRFGQTDWLVAWRSLDTQSVDIRILDELGEENGAVSLASGVESGRQTFDVLRPHGTPQVDEFFVAALLESVDTELYRCSGTDCQSQLSTSSMFGTQRATAVEGFWQGAEEYPYIAFQTASAISTQVYVRDSYVTVHTADGGPTSWFDIKPEGLPASPDLTTPTLIHGAFDEGFAFSSRLMASTEIVQTLKTCEVPIGPLGRIETVPDRVSAPWVVDTKAENGTLISELECSLGRTSPITGRAIANLVDWDAAFEVGDDQLVLSYIDGEVVWLMTNDASEPRALARGPIRRVAVSGSSEAFNALLVDAEGSVEFVRAPRDFESCVE